MQGRNQGARAALSGAGLAVKVFGWGPVGLAVLIFLLPFLFAPFIFFWGNQAHTELEGGEMYYQLGGAVRYAEEINAAASRHDLDPALLAAVIERESGFNPKATNARSGAAGLMQLMPMNYEGIDPYDPAQNINKGAELLREYLDMFDQDLEKALAAYNGGPANVIRLGGIPNFEETENYVPAVMKNYKYFQKYAVPVFEGSGELGNPAPDTVMGSAYGPRNGSIHRGQDFPGKIGTPILAAGDGKVTRVEHLGDKSYGSFVVIDHGGGITTLYAHMYDYQVKVKKGQKVERGQQIGEIGNNGKSTGPHLHFEVRKDNHPIDPRPFLKSKD